MTYNEYLETLDTIVEQYPHLKIVETNSSLSDFPKNIIKGIIGFSSMEEAQEVVYKFGFSDFSNLYELDRLAGHHFYTRKGYGAYNGIDYYNILSDDEIEAESIKDRCTSLSYDSHNYEIGLIKVDFDEDSDDED